MWIPAWWRALRQFSRPELPRAYWRRGRAVFEPDPDVIFRLIEFVAQEMEAHRRRQAWVFREAVIVIGILTWAAFSVPVVRSADFLYRAITGGVTAIICIIIGVVGWYIVFLYRHRIYHLRKRREELVSYLRPEWEDERRANLALQHSRPEDPRPVERPRPRAERYKRATWLFPPIGPPISSVAYGWLLIPVGVLSFALNIAAIGITSENSGTQQPNRTGAQTWQVEGDRVVNTDSTPVDSADQDACIALIRPDGQ